MTPTNGNKSLQHVLESTIEKLEKDGEHTAAITLTVLNDTNQRVTTLAERAGERDKYPSLTFLILRRPLSAIPFTLAALLGLSGLWIEEIRTQMLSLLGIKPDILMDISPASILVGIIFFAGTGLVAQSQYQNK